MSYLLVVANQPSTNTQLLAKAIFSGTQRSNFPSKLKSPMDTTIEDVLSASGLIIGTTENFGYMSGQIKDFFERIYYPCLQETQGKPWALYVSAGQDGTGAVNSVERIVSGLKWRKIQEAIVLKTPFNESYIQKCQELGECMAIGLETKIF